MDPDDDTDSPFAHVPMPGAGPIPLQEGPFTYEKVVASAGRGSLRGGSTWRSGCMVLMIGLAILAATAIALTVLR